MNACIRGAAHSVGGVRGPFGGPARTPALTPYHTRNINHINEQTYGGAMVYTQATTVTASLFREQNAAEPPSKGESPVVLRALPPS